MLTLALIFQSVVLFVIPIAVGLWLNRRWGLSWILFLGGALAYVASWVVVSIIPVAGVLSLVLSSITQMGALYLIYRFQFKTVRTEREAIMVGVGQGGMELILVGLVALLTFLQLRPLRYATDETLISLAARTESISEEEVQPAQIDDIRERISDYWDTPWYEPLIQLVQPLAFLPIQASLAVMVLGAVTQKDLRPLLGAMAMHYLSRVLPAYGAFLGGVAVWLGLSLLFGGIAVWFLNRLRPIVRHQNEVALSQRRKAETQAKRVR